MDIRRSVPSFLSLRKNGKTARCGKCRVPVLNAAPVFPCPEWVKDAVFYQIFPDRFARSAEYVPPGKFCVWGSAPTVQGMCGGNLRGIIERLDYIKNLG